MQTETILIILSTVVALLAWLFDRLWMQYSSKNAVGRQVSMLGQMVDQGALLTNHEGVIQWVNDGFCRMSGMAPSELINNTLEVALLESIPNPRSIQQLRNGLASGKSFSVELLSSHKDGHRYWLSLHLTPFKGKKDKVPSYVVLGLDVTARKQAEEDLLVVNRRTESLLDIGEGVFTLDPQGRITFVNPAASRLTGWTASELVGQPMGILVHQVKIGKVTGDQRDYFLTAALQQGTVLVGETDIFRRKDGTLFDVEYASSPTRESNTGPGGIVLFRDVAGRRREEAFRREQEQLVGFRAEIAFSMAGPDPLRLCLQKCAQSMVRYLQGDFARIWTLNPQQNTLELQAGAGICTQIDGDQSVVTFGSSEVGIIARDNAPTRIDDLADNPIVGNREWIRREELLSFVGLPLCSEGQVIGVVAVYSKKRLPEDSLMSLGQVAETMARGIVQKATLERLTEQAALLDKSQDAIVVIDLSHGVTFWNKSAERLYGWAAHEVLGKQIDDFICRDRSYFERASRDTLAHGEWKGECCHLNKGDETIIVESQWTLIHDQTGRPKSILMVNTDITEKKKIETQFLRTQRMESLGTLAGGIAHDLNNVLAPILMSAQILKEKFPDEDACRLLTVVESSAKRGADMVRQVLTFSRGLDGERVLLQPRHLIKEVVKILGETFPKSIVIKTNLPQDLWPTIGDATQLHQVLVNLLVNGRDAMPNGGTLTLSAENANLEPNPAPGEVPPGQYVLIKVTDTGTGISSEILEKIFEPFFTTKEMGKGTGLGLATVLGIVKGHNGFVQVQTELNRGTTFLVYLPAAAGVQEKSNDRHQGLPRGRGETILAVDDEASVLFMTKETLEHHGYRVLTASDGTEAIAAYSAHRDEIKGVLTDMLMPHMDGPATIRVLKKLDPDLKILAASGLMDGERVKEVTGLDNITFLMKPFTTEKLLETMHTLLQERQ